MDLYWTIQEIWIGQVAHNLQNNFHFKISELTISHLIKNKMKKVLLEPSENDRLGNGKENNNFSIFYQNLIILGLGDF